MMMPSDIYIELQKLKAEKDKLLNGRELEDIKFYELYNLYGLVCKIEAFQMVISR
jgi:hypothetical protein